MKSKARCQLNKYEAQSLIKNFYYPYDDQTFLQCQFFMKRVLINNLTISSFDIFILIKMSSNKQTLSDKDGFALNITRKDQIKILKKKMFMLKEAVFQQRNKKSQLHQQLTSIQEKLKKYQIENKRKEEKSQALMNEIKLLKDTLIQERNEKQAYIQELDSKEDAQTIKNQASKTRMESSKFFGLKGLFQS